ncbi:hypothetical protein NC652_002306 [Populus alba x Populus x berolinensis]|nr:hypothetical protein NC652_002306 [Populus alba x Populus x berolinensis]
MGARSWSVPFRHPWKLYLKVGTLARECAYRIEALNGCLNADIQVSSEVRSMHNYELRIWEKALKETCIGNQNNGPPQASSADPHIENANSAAKGVKYQNLTQIRHMGRH